jgi:uncharacterized lipoprotein
MKHLLLCIIISLSACSTSQEKEEKQIEDQAQQELKNGF